jgi:4-hydroxy-3-methylbut-2-enyl diphosphate reductase
MCFGVRDAIALATEQAQAHPLTVLGDLVHNETVLADLRARGVRIVQQVGAVETQAVMITAHGASEKAINRVRQRGLAVMEATCPLVHAAHRAVARLVGEGYYPVIIGKRDHVEVRGLTGDLKRCEVIGKIEEVRTWAAERLGVICQSTVAPETAQAILGAIRAHNPGKDICYVPTICRPTSSPLSFLIEIATEYSHASPTFGWRTVPSTRRGEKVGCASAPGTKRRCLRHDGQTGALARTTARQCGQVRVVPAGVFRAMLTTRDATPV